MYYVENWMRKRKDRLLCLMHAKEKAIRLAPEGFLRVSESKNRVQFYQRLDSKTTSGIYIAEKNRELAALLAQKDYDQKVLRSCEREIKAIDKFLGMLPEKKAEDIYKSLHLARQGLVIPIMETDEQFIRRWATWEYERKEIDKTVPILQTEKGERVRSKSEMMIADLLYREGIPYKYECPITLKGYGKIHPDFSILDVKRRKVIYWEHFGRMDDPEYAEKAIQRIKAYEQNGIYMGDNLIVTWESKRNPLSQGEIRRQIRRILDGEADM